MVKETEFYELLHVEVTANDTEIKRAYRRLALKYHPDKNPDDPEAAEMFKKISHAYETLSDNDKRQLYDRHGKDGLDGSGGGGGGFHDASDIFSMFFGGGRRSEPKPRDLVHELPVTLEEMYNGRTRKVQVTRSRRCDSCNAQGVKPGAKLMACNRCRGTGVEQRIREVFLGMREVVGCRCEACRGQGTVAKPSDVCPDCRGQGIARSKTVLEVHIEKGARHNDVIRFNGEGDHAAGMQQAGDVLIFLAQKEHDVFVRKGNHLLMKYAISLQEALCGFDLPLEHLDGRLLQVSVPPGQVIDGDSVWQVYNEGMPLKGTGGTQRGNIFVLFTVEWPDTIPAAQIEKIATAFDHPAKMPVMGGQRVELRAMPQQRQRRGAPAQAGSSNQQQFSSVKTAHFSKSRASPHNEEEYEDDDDEDDYVDMDSEQEDDNGEFSPHMFAQQAGFPPGMQFANGGQAVQCAQQ